MLFFCVCEWLTNCYKEPASPAWRCWEERWLIPLTSKPPSFRRRRRGGVTAWQNDPNALLRAVWVRTASSSPAWQRWLQFKVSAVRCRFHCAANWKTRSRKVFLPVKQYTVSLLGSSSPGKRWGLSVPFMECLTVFFDLKSLQAAVACGS